MLYPDTRNTKNNKSHSLFLSKFFLFWNTALPLIIMFLALCHLMLAYFGQQKPYGRQGTKYKTLPTSSDLTREEMLLHSIFKK